MISKKSGYNDAFVWVWLPGETEPVVAGKLAADGDNLIFNYGKSYLERKGAISMPCYGVGRISTLMLSRILGSNLPRFRRLPMMCAPQTRDKLFI